MLQPEYLMSVADPVVEVYRQVETDILNDIVRRISKTNTFTQTASWQLQRAKEFGYFSGDVTSILAKATNMSEKEIKRIMAESGAKALAFDDTIYKAAGLTPIKLTESPALMAMLLQGTSDTLQLLSNFTKTTANTANICFNNILDEAFLKILTGTFDPITAIKTAINKIASQGINKIAYPSGYEASTEVAVRRAVVTGVNQATSKLQLERASEMGCDLVEVTSHAGARPSHAVWQGQVYCINGTTREYGNLAEETGYGEGDGLCGWNCYHSFYPYFEGLSTQAFVHDPSYEYLGKSNDEMYDEQQKQRYYERQIRAAKKECEVYSAAMNACDNPQLKAEIQDNLLKSSNKLRSRESKLNEFLEKTGRTKDPTRVYVGGWSRNDMTTSKTKIAREAREAKVIKSPFVEGRDISGTWARRPEQFAYEIEDVINAQGFDGLPRVVSASEFEKAVQESNIICQRIYNARSEEALRAYQEALYRGDWYVDCSEGGSAFGRGMYCFCERGTAPTVKMADGLMSYQDYDRSIVETFTLDKAAKTITFEELKAITPEGMEPTVFATLKGYSAVTDCGRRKYTVVLNRTSCIFKEGAGIQTGDMIQEYYEKMHGWR